MPTFLSKLPCIFSLYLRSKQSLINWYRKWCRRCDSMVCHSFGSISISLWFVGIVNDTWTRLAYLFCVRNELVTMHATLNNHLITMHAQNKCSIASRCFFLFVLHRKCFKYWTRSTHDVHWNEKGTGRKEFRGGRNELFLKIPTASALANHYVFLVCLFISSWTLDAPVNVKSKCKCVEDEHNSNIKR